MIGLTKEQSKTLTLLKGFAIILVVMIHCDVRNAMGVEHLSGLDLYMQGLTRVIVINAVPLFFFISGYLFFLKKDTYQNKWKKRFKSLVIPYIIWCIIGFLIPFVFQQVLGLGYLFKGGEGHLKPIAEFEAWDYLKMFWNIRDGLPILSTLWFLRNLILLVALTPIFHFLATRLKWGFPVLLAANYLIFHQNFLCLSSADMFFFGMGNWLMLSRNSGRVLLLDKQKYNWLIPIWLLAFTIDLIAYYYDTQETLARNIFVVIDCMLMYRLMRTAVDKWNMTWLVNISAASFFIYLFHEPWLGYIQGMFFKFVHPTGFFCYLMPWLFCTLAVGYSYIAYLILKRFVPKLLNVMTGAR